MDLDLPPLKEDDITLTFYSPAFVSAVLKDNDGDIVMQDLDDPSVTSRIVEVVEGTRTGVFQAQPEDVVFPLPPYCYLLTPSCRHPRTYRTGLNRLSNGYWWLTQISSCPIFIW